MGVWVVSLAAVTLTLSAQTMSVSMGELSGAFPLIHTVIPTSPGPTTSSAMSPWAPDRSSISTAVTTGSDAPEIPAALWQQLARFQLLLPLLRQQVIAEAVRDIQISPEDSTRAQQAWGGHHRLRSAEALQAFLRSQAINEADAIWQAELPLRIQRYCSEHFLHRAEQRFLARKNQLDLVIYSLLRVEDPSLARELYLRISEGEADFAELAVQYAKGPEQATRGVVGPVPLTQAHPLLAERLRTSRPGQLLPPFAIENWWLVVRLETLRAASFDDDMQQRMARELFDAWVEEEVAQRIQEHSQP
jgi:parvulin-like peptidyl-prolyl isomerase